MVMINKDQFLLKGMQNKIRNEFGTGLWIPVYVEKKNKMDEITFWSYLVANKCIAEYLKESVWDLMIGDGFPGCVKEEGNVNYYRFGDRDGIEPLVFIRNFIGDKKNHVEISEEFIHFHNLWLDKTTNIYYNIDNCGNQDPVIKIDGMNVEIKLRYLKQFLAIKEMHLALGFEIDQYSDQTLEDMNLKECNTTIQLDKTIYDTYLIDNTVFRDENDKLALCRINGKKFIQGMDKEDSGIWPYNKKKEYEKFIIDTDENGENNIFTCNPKELANYFGANPDSPHYLTPIFFNRDVLRKYYSKASLYSVADSYIHLNGSWSLRVDNHNQGYVIAYLGDLGRDIPYHEQQHWKSFNIVPDGKLSKVKSKRDFEGKWTDVEISDLKFKSLFDRFNGEWEKKYGYKLFLDLSDEDQHHFLSLRIPLNNEQSEFDSQVSSLVKIIIDSLNEKELIKNISIKDISGSI